MDIRRNVVANYIGTFVVVLAPMIALPYYLNALGLNNWGLICFVTMLQALLSILDAGASQSLIKEFASVNFKTQSGVKRLGKLLFGFERIYWLFAFAICACLIIFSDLIVRKWLNVGIYNFDNAKITIYSGALIFFFQFPGSIYRSFLVGTQQQVSLNLIVSFTALLKHFVGVMLLVFWPKLFVYLVWQIIITGVETFLRGVFSWNSLKLKRRIFLWDKSTVISLVPSVAMMSFVTILGVLTVQIDKLILSGMVPLERFAVYVTASSIALGSLQLIHPITNAAIPYIVKIIAQKNLLRKFNYFLFKSALSIILFLGLIFYFLGLDVLTLWLKNSEVANEIYKLLQFLLIGSALNVLYTIGYVSWLVSGKFFKLLQVNLLSLLMSIIFTPLLIINFGLNGASFGWILINFTGLVMSLGWMFKVR